MSKHTLTLFLEGELTLLIVVFVLSTTTILASLLVVESASCSTVMVGGGVWTNKRVGVGEVYAYFSLILRHLDDCSE